MNIYLLFVIVLFLLAVSDLIVGVANDAVNFLNSAIGSKVAPVKVIMTVAGLGVLLGATFSSGMMEIARSGVFYPGQFFFSEIMIIFLAVMLTDVMLLDTFNTFGLPTSTTVSIIFELLGAAVAVTLIKISNTTGDYSDFTNYINAGKALAMISGILLSVVIAFSVGTIIQFFTRLIFSFNYERYMKYFGALWGGIAITAIVYFMLVKGAKGASFMTPGTVEWIQNNTGKLLLFSFTAVTIILQILFSAFRINILRIIVLVGTFSLAMAFAGNDLVNFIGVPLAGFESFKQFAADPAAGPDSFTMEALMGPVKTPLYFLLIAGIIMVLTIFFSKKARSVTKTEVNLASQDTGNERFSSSMLSRSVVRGSVGLSKFIDRFIPGKVNYFLEKRFDFKSHKNKSREKKDAPSFDLLRASVNMFVASILIASATSIKLPLSTTYVTFMVAMGTSLADRAWGRETAVYRITGVLTVIGGWFVTAFTAFSGAFLIAIFLHWGGAPATFLTIIIAFLLVIRTHFIHKKREEKENKRDELNDTETLNGENIIHRCNSSVNNVITSVSKLYLSSLQNLIREDIRKMRKTTKKVEELNIYAKELKYNIYATLKKLEEGSVETGPYYVQILDYIREVAHSLRFIADPIFEHLNNNHLPLIPEQVRDINEIVEAVSSFFMEINNINKNHDFKNLDAMIARQQTILNLITKAKKKQIKFIKSDLVGTKNTILYLNILSESKNLVLHTTNMIKSYRDFVINDENTKKAVLTSSTY